MPTTSGPSMSCSPSRRASPPKPFRIAPVTRLNIKNGRGIDDMTSFRTVLRLTAILASVVFFGVTTGFAEDLGPAIGTKAPDIGTRLDQTGKPRQLADLMGRNGLVLMFFRSAEWCPFCQAQLVDI